MTHLVKRRQPSRVWTAVTPLLAVVLTGGAAVGDG